MIEIVCIVSESSKKKYTGLNKINNSEFNINIIKDKFISTDKFLLENIYNENDPKEIKIVLNEFYNSISKCNLCNSIYWISWIIEWEKLNIKKYKKYICGYRKITGVDSKYHTDIIWLIWEIILKITYIKDIDFLTKQIQSLYQLFKINYSN